MSFATALSRVTGYGRTLVQAAVLGGTGVVANAYTFSNTLPNQIYELFMGGLLSSIFIPILVERLTRHGEDDARRLTNALLTIIVPVLVVVSVLGILFAGPLVALTTDFKPTGTFSAAEAQRATELSVLLFRIFAFKILFYGLGALAMGVLNSRRRFFLPTVAPVLNNLIVIGAFVLYAFIAPENPLTAIYVLAGGTTLGVAVMSLVLFPSVWRLGYRPRIVRGHPALGSAARLAGPMLLFVASSVGVQAVANLVGSSFGGVANLWYAFMIFTLPYGVFVVAIGTALMPELSERYAQGDTDGYRDTLSFGLRIMAFIVVPAAVGMIALSEPITALLYERGRFTPQDTNIVAALLTAYGVGLLGYAAYFVLVRSFYSRQNTLTPAILNVVLLVLYVVLAYGLSASTGLVGVALAFSIAYGVLAVGLLVAMRTQIGRLDGRRMAVSLGRILISGAVMYAVAAAAVSVTGNGDNIVERALIVALVGGFSVAVYAGIALMLQTEELWSAIRLIRRREVPKGA
jgi:putative peptidoglycan lipid II flippase